MEHSRKKCIRCGSENTRPHGKTGRIICKDCRRTFTQNSLPPLTGEECPACNSTDINRQGGRRRLCKYCGRQWTKSPKTRGRKPAYNGKVKKINVRLYPVHVEALSKFPGEKITNKIISCIENSMELQ